MTEAQDIDGLTEIWADSYVHPPAASYEVSGELWQLVTTIHDDGYLDIMA